MKEILAKLLEREHCETLATFFGLTPADRDTVLNDPKPGMSLVKILNEREIIMPNKVFGLYQGLKASHLDKIEHHVLQYIDESQKEKFNDSKRVPEDKKEVCYRKMITTYLTQVSELISCVPEKRLESSILLTFIC